ncbi:MAG: circularly permuted type 2 ATP-grasp protein, partial [Pseudomonadota bacterium]
MFNEMYLGDDVRPEYRIIADWVAREGVEALLTKRAEAEALFRRVGITFAVYGEGGDPERLIPFDMIPRVFGASEWSKIEAGCIQRTRALNAFLSDVYSTQEILKAGLIPADLVTSNSAYEPIMEGYTPPLGVFSHVCGVDLVRVSPDETYVLEDNCRTPSGVSYLLQNREVMERMFPPLFETGHIRPVGQYGDMLAEAMAEVAPPNCPGAPTLALMTPGHFNSAYYEHSFL